MRDGVTCGGQAVPKVRIPEGGGLGTSVGTLLANAGEMVVLFCWDGGERVYDADYVTWDDDAQDASAHVDKSELEGYEPDTAIARQSTAPVPGDGESIGRCDASEPDETASGGNGVAGHDETRETFATSFEVLGSPSPGAENVCG